MALAIPVYVLLFPVADVTVGKAFTVQLTLLLLDVEQPLPVAVLLLSIKLVPTTATKLGTEALQALQIPPLLVEKRYSSAVVPVPPVPAVILTVNVVPGHTVATFGFLVNPGATGWATTVTATAVLAAELIPLPSLTVTV